MDIDSVLLDRLFQPLADRLAAWISCFGLARLSLAVAVGLQCIVVMIDMRGAIEPVQRVAAVGISLLALFGAQQAWSLITRTERQARPGNLNLRRITLRWQRVAWIAVTVWSVAAGVTAGEGGLGLAGACFAWLGIVYFVSCTPLPPPARVELRQMFA